MGELEGRQQTLGGDAADAAPLGALDGLVGVVLGIAVEAFGAVTQPVVDPLLVGGFIGQCLGVLGAVLGGDGDAVLAADLRWADRAGCWMDKRQTRVGADAGALDRTPDLPGRRRAGEALVTFAVGSAFRRELISGPGGDLAPVKVGDRGGLGNTAWSTLTPRTKGSTRDRACRESTPAAATMVVSGTPLSINSTSRPDRSRPIFSTGVPGASWVRDRKPVTVFLPRA
ncbi:hypothetical protein OG884_16780 [Streptosporangium sp. NBC_01755]|uniref:hypothetical protein n=1 Tax=Streptosporangium sp. NBC_01755 TaxID=2975949 RepID=UPI002DDB12A6|nr:hypothetical protein [Streptosporangium sp. NBC_01755]WSD03474.1 hypothetical protein OG884_16780 [Streptosporangium sp. NBC_01755]